MSTENEAEDRSRRAEIVQKEIEEMRRGIDNTERFRSQLSADNERGHDLLLRCLVELELNLDRLLKEAASLVT